MSNRLQSYLEQQQQTHNLPSSLGELLLATSQVCKKISDLLAGGAMVGALGSADTQNVQGETQKKLDIISNELFLQQLQGCTDLAGLASEEMEVFIPTKQAESGRYLILFDPLDGSSNIDVNISVGTIFSILEKPPGKKPTEADFLQPGNQQIAAGFTVYGPATLLVLATANDFATFTLDRASGEFVKNDIELRIPVSTAEFAINVSNQRFWEAPVQRYISECMAGKEGFRGKNFNMRWVASMVADVYRVLSRGGIFMYPKDNKDPTKEGKLRLMYEANPMSFIVERAGGLSSTGRQRILDIKPKALHQRVPVILGSKEEVERVLRYHD